MSTKFDACRFCYPYRAKAVELRACSFCKNYACDICRDCFDGAIGSRCCTLRPWTDEEIKNSPVVKKHAMERAEEFRAMVQRWRDESPEGYDEAAMAVLREEMPHKFADPKPPEEAVRCGGGGYIVAYPHTEGSECCPGCADCDPVHAVDVCSECGTVLGPVEEPSNE